MMAKLTAALGKTQFQAWVDEIKTAKQDPDFSFLVVPAQDLDCAWHNTKDMVICEE